jgi:fatty-acid desaturase
MFYIILSLLVFHLGHGVFAHRYFTHRMFIISDNAKLIGHLLFTFINWGSASTFAAIHYNHHKYSGTDKDPHEWRHIGLWNTFIGNYKLNYDKTIFKNSLKQKYAKFFHKNYFKILVIGMPLMAPVTALAFWLRAISIILGHSDIGDTSNRRNNDTSVNAWYLYPILWGDEAHTEHHNNLRLPKLHNYDLIYYLSLILRKL